jgi:iron complex transport system ATP-binding protein
MIQTLDLAIGYGPKLLTVEDMELSSGVYILMGKNGSGKSTFLKTLTGTLSPLQGTVYLNGISVHTISDVERPKHIAFVQTQFPVVDFLRVSEYLGLGRSPYTSFFGRMSEKDHELVQSALSALNIKHLANRFTNEISDGERQLVAIARTFAQETPVILLDEPTAYLDYQNKQLILEQLIRLAKKHNKCILLSSHDIDLSIHSSAHFLVVEDARKRLVLLPPNTSKNDIIDRAF